ncbi:MAG: GC-type dockerin domain-anchored protein [bacterium]|nr:GC-type dockerin domain-anchored protein [bacterium]
MPFLIGRLKKEKLGDGKCLEDIDRAGFTCPHQKSSRKPSSSQLSQREFLLRSMLAADENTARSLIEKHKDKFDYLEVEAPVSLPLYAGDMGKYGGPYQPPVSPPSAITTPDFKHLQKYLNDPPEGIGLNWLLAHLPKRIGLRGEGIKIIDIEGNWNNQHEDLPDNNGGIIAGTPLQGDIWFNHGTAVLGVLGGDDNYGGVYGIAPKSVHLQISQGMGIVNAILRAGQELSYGDFLLLEMQTSPPAGTPESMYQYVPLEYYDYFFDAIKSVTDRGIVVVEPGANGSAWLDDPVFNRKFDRTFRDSGAIMVGACSIDHPHWSLQFSSHGSRLDIRAPGEYGMTCGYGGYYRGPNQPHQDYEAAFGGTSLASPIETGCGELVQACRKAQGLPLFNSIQMRDLFVTTGSPQEDPWNPVGKFPNLIKALQYGAPIPDMNLSGKCDFDDYFLFAELFNTNDPRGDFNGNGLVDMEDFNIFAAQFNADNPSA